MSRGAAHRLGRSAALAGAMLSLAAAPASAAWLELSVRGAGTVTSQSNLESSVSMTCTGTAASTAASPAACRTAYPLSPDGSGGWIPQQLTVRATPATGWRFSGWGSQPAGSSPTTIALEVTTPLIATFANAAPAVTIDAVPATAGTAVPLALRATDDSKIVSATIEVRGPSGAVVFSTTKPAVPLSASWSTANLPAGTYTITGRATDDGGATSTATARSTNIAAPTGSSGAGSGTGAGTPTAESGGAAPTLEASGDSATAAADGPTAAGAPGRAGFRYVWRSRTIDARTTFTRLTIRQLTDGATLRVTCRGRGCPKGTRLARKGSRWTPRALVGRRLGPGATVELRATKPGTTGRVVRLHTHAGRAPSTVDLCLPPGAKRPAACT